MKLDFLSLKISDFKAFRGDHTLLLNEGGVTFVGGENQANTRLTANGAAKSSMWDALTWCLFGKTPRGLHNPDIIPWKTGGKPSVVVALRCDTKEHTVQRTHQPNRLLLNDKEVAQATIDDLLGINFDLMVNTVLLAQGRPLFFDYKPEAKMELFSDTLRLTRWDSYSERAGLITKAAEQELSAAEEDKAVLKGTLEELAGLLDTAKKKAEAWAGEARIKSKRAAEQIVQLERDHDAKLKRLADTQLREDGAKLELKSLNAEERKLEGEISKLQLSISQFKIRAEERERRIEEIEGELTAIGSAKTCPTCGQSIKPKNVEAHRAHLKEKLAEYKEANQPAPKKLIGGLGVLQERLRSITSYQSTFQAKADGAEAELGRLLPEAAAAKAALDECRKRAKEETVNPYTDQINQLKKKQKELEAEFVKVDHEAVAFSRKAERHRFWVRGFKDIKLQLIDDVLQELDIVTAGMLEAVGLVDWQVRYDIERETKSGSIQRKLNVSINSPESEGFVRWESWSGGEAQRLKLVGALALSDVLLAQAGVQVNLEILDEPTLYWSREGVQELCGFLAERARQQDKSIFYIEHNAVKSTHFARTLTVVKDNKGAYIVED